MGEELKINSKEIESAFMLAMVTYLYKKGLLTIEEVNAIRDDLISGNMLLDNITLQSDVYDRRFII